MPFMIKNKNGYVTTGMIAVIVAAGILIVPLTRWYISMSQWTHNLDEQLKTQYIIRDFWDRINAATYDEFNASIAARGTTWTEDVEGKYTLTAEFGPDGKYVNAACNTEAVAGEDDRHCRKAKIILASNDDPFFVKSFSTTKISQFSESKYLKNMENKIASNTTGIAGLNTRMANVESRLGNLANRVTALEQNGGGGIKYQHLAQNGYVEFANGFMIQWGYQSRSGEQTSVYYPKAFAHQTSAVALSSNRETPSGVGRGHCIGVSRGGFQGVWDGPYGYWTALGY